MTKVSYPAYGGVHPSPSMWGDCPEEALNAEGTGYFFHEDFLSGSVSSAFTAAMTIGRGILSFGGDTDTIVAFKASEVGGYIDIETDGDDNDGFALFTEPMVKIVKDSGKRIWLEARIEIGDADGDQGFFFGLAEEACQTHDVVADDCADLITETLIGYRIFTGENAIDFVAQKDDGAEVVVLSDVTNQAAIDTELGSGSKSALADDVEWKLGLTFDGKDKVRVWVQGVLVATWTLSATYYDKDKYLLPVLALKTGAAAVESLAIDWIRFGCEW